MIWKSVLDPNINIEGDIKVRFISKYCHNEWSWQWFWSDMMWSDLWKYWFSLKWSKLIYFQKHLKNFSLKNWRCLWNFSNCQLSLAFQNLFNITSTAHQNHTSFVLVNFGRTWNEMNWSDLWKWQFELKWSKELHFQDDFCWSDADKFLNCRCKEGFFWKTKWFENICCSCKLGSPVSVVSIISTAIQKLVNVTSTKPSWKWSSLLHFSSN